MRTALTVLAVLFASFAPVPQALAQQGIIESVTEDIQEGDPESHDDKGGCVDINENVTSPVRAGERSFKHVVRDCAERAEIGMEETEIGETYWLGWSLYIPEDYEPTSKGNIFAQWAAWPDEESTEFPCQGIGHKMGLYTGDPGWEGPSPAVVYTDEYRLGEADAGFEAVAPGKE